MNGLLLGLLSAMLATNPPMAVSNLVAEISGISIRVPNPDDPVEREFRKVMEQDDAAQAEVDDWILENRQFAAEGAGISRAELRRRIRKRFEPVRQAYEDFIRRHPDHAGARIAFASFLDDLHEEDAEMEQLEKARELDPKNPAVWNNLANYYTHAGPVTNAFAYYEKAIELDPKETIYWQNLAVTAFMFRQDSMRYYHLNEQQVFDKAQALYAKALQLDPTNFPLATDLAQSYYIIRPVRTEEALRAWTNALHLAHDEIEREGVYLHFARFKMNVGRFDEARAHLNAVTNEMYDALKARLMRNLLEKEKLANEANKPAASVEKPITAGK